MGTFSPKIITCCPDKISYLTTKIESSKINVEIGDYARLAKLFPQHNKLFLAKIRGLVAIPIFEDLYHLKNLNNGEITQLVQRKVLQVVDQSKSPIRGTILKDFLHYAFLFPELKEEIRKKLSYQEALGDLSIHGLAIYMEFFPDKKDEIVSMYNRYHTVPFTQDELKYLFKENNKLLELVIHDHIATHFYIKNFDEISEDFARLPERIKIIIARSIQFIANNEKNIKSFLEKNPELASYLGIEKISRIKKLKVGSLLFDANPENPDFKFERFYCLTSLSRDVSSEEKTQKPTFLHVAKLSGAVLESIRKRGEEDFSQIVVLRVVDIEAGKERDLLELLNKLPKLLHVALPHVLRGNAQITAYLSEKGITHEFVDYKQKYKLVKKEERISPSGASDRLRVGAGRGVGGLKVMGSKGIEGSAAGGDVAGVGAASQNPSTGLFKRVAGHGVRAGVSGSDLHGNPFDETDVAGEDSFISAGAGGIVGPVSRGFAGKKAITGPQIVAASGYESEESDKEDVVAEEGAGGGKSPDKKTPSSNPLPRPATPVDILEPGDDRNEPLESAVEESGVGVGGGGGRKKIGGKDALFVPADDKEEADIADRETGPRTFFMPLQDRDYLPPLLPLPLLPKLDESFELEKIEDEEKLKEAVFNSENKKILIVAKSGVDAHANYLIAEARGRGKSVFYIDSPRKIDFDRLNLLLVKHASGVDPIISPSGLLGEFLGLEPKANSLLFINWSAFNSRERLALNTLIDLHRTIHGRDIAGEMPIVSFYKDQPKDPSFISRHNKSFTSDLNLSRKEIVVEAATAEGPIIVDLQGFPNWRRTLFGRVILVDNKMQWQKSQFVCDLEVGKINFEILNISKEDQVKLRYELEQAKAMRFLEYHGYEIPINPNLKFKFPAKVFDFSRFEECFLEKSVTYDRITAPSQYQIINTFLFDILLQDKKVAGGNYIEEDGLIIRASRSEDRILKLFITSELSQNQWYCLFRQANDLGVTLDLKLAPGINAPSKIKIKSLVGVEEAKAAHEDFVAARSPMPRIIVSNDTNKVAESLKSTETYAVIDVEDFSYQDLVENIDFKYKADNSGFKNFEKITSKLLEQLRLGRKVILKGKFDSDLLQMLHPMLVGKAPEFDGIAESLVVIIEEPTLSRSSREHESLKFLPKIYYELRYEEKTAVKDVKIKREELDKSSLDYDSKRKSDEFIEKRRRDFIELINESNLVQMIGHSGVGKSRLMKMFEENPRCGIRIYREMKDFESWAEDIDVGVTKILFIDESNIEDTNTKSHL